MSRYSPRNVLEKEPAAIQAAALAVVNGLAVFEVIDMSTPQLGAINVALGLVLGLFVRQSVTANANL